MTAAEQWRAFWAEYHAGQWEPGTRNWITSNLEPGDVLLDVGAWIGPVTRWALDAGARVIAIEPDGVAYLELARRCPDAACIPAALALDPTPRLLGPKPASEGKGMPGDSMSRIVDTGGIETACVTMLGALGGLTPRLVKIDVEGYELTLLPFIAPLVAEMGAGLRVSLHGEWPEREWFSLFKHVEWPDSKHGDITCS